MKKWRVLHIFHHYPPTVSGYSKRSREIIKHTALFSSQVIVTPPIDKNKIPKESVTYSGNGEEIYRLKKSPLPPIRHIGHRLVERLMLERLIRRVFKEHKFDLLHAHMPYLYAEPVMRYAKKKGIKIIYEVRGVWEDSAVAENKIEENSSKYQRRKKGEERTMALADKIVVLSNPLAKEIEERGFEKEKISIVGNAVDCSDFQPQRHSNRIEVLYHLKGKFVIGYVGTLRKMEGLQNIIRLIPQLKKQNIPVSFFIVGYGEYKKELLNLVDELGLNDDVIFAGAIPPEMIDKYYSVMDILVFPRLRLRVTELVSPLKPLEAMAMGKPILASNVGGLTDYCIDQENALLFNPDDPAESLQKLTEMVENKELRTRLSESARKWVQTNRDWKQQAQHYQHLYQELAP